MGFSDKQLNALRKSLSASDMRTRQVQGRTLSYIEGWHAIAEANRIFGFDGWDRETIETRCVHARENRGTFHAVYVARVRITVRAEGEPVVREGHGTGEAQGGSVGETHEKALKTAETDATKRTLATFGKPFGLSLYLSPKSVHAQPFGPPIADQDRRRTLQQLGADGRYYVPRRPPSAIEQELKVPISKVLESQITPTDRKAATDKSQVLHAAPTTPEEASPVPSPPMSGSLTRVTSSEKQSAGAAGGPVPALGPTPSIEALAPPNPEHAPNLLQTISAPLTQPQTPEADHSPPRLLIERPTRHRDPDHLKFVRSQPCLVCGRTPSDAHHLRFAQSRALGRKVSDEYTVPLCRIHHRLLHQESKEPEWWVAVDRDIDPLEVARALWIESRRKIAESANSPSAAS